MNRLQHHRSLTTGNRPTTSDEGLYAGSLWINFPDKQLGTVDDGNNVVDFLPIRFFSATADYAVGDLVVNQAKLWRALNAVTAAAWMRQIGKRFAGLAPCSGRCKVSPGCQSVLQK